MSDVMSRLAAALESRYGIGREIGVGGMATVYLAHDLRHERDVAIKVLHPDLAAALGAERFLADPQTLARVQPSLGWSTTPDGRFLLARISKAAERHSLKVILNWASTLNARD